MTALQQYPVCFLLLSLHIVRTEGGFKTAAVLARAWTDSGNSLFS